MAREYKVIEDDYSKLPKIVFSYNEVGLNWKQAKKQLRDWYLVRARQIRAMRKTDITEDYKDDQVPQ